MQNNFYIYIHFRKDNLQPFYVGKGKGKRFLSNRSRNIYWKRIVNKYGYFPQIMENNLTEEQAFEREKFYIQILGRENLCNMTDGGDGSTGCIPSQETRKKMSENRKGEKNGFFGKKHTDEVMKKMSKNSFNAKKVINIKTNEIYKSAEELAKILNMKSDTLRAYLNGKLKNKTDFKYL